MKSGRAPATQKAESSGSRRYFVLSLKPGIEFAFFDRVKSLILQADGSQTHVRMTQGRSSAGAHQELRPVTAFFLGAGL